MPQVSRTPADRTSDAFRWILRRLDPVMVDIIQEGGFKSWRWIDSNTLELVDIDDQVYKAVITLPIAKIG